MIEFDTELVKERATVRLWVPAELAEAFGGDPLVPAVVTINGTPVRTTLHKRHGAYLMIVNKQVQAMIAGDTVHVRIERDVAERAVELPSDLADALAAAGARAAFDALTLFRQNELVGSVTAARREDTRVRRINAAVESLTPAARSGTGSG